MAQTNDVVAKRKARVHLPSIDRLVGLNAFRARVRALATASSEDAELKDFLEA